MTLIELRQERGSLIEQARKIQQKATEEKRQMTAEEGAEFDRLLDASDELLAQIETNPSRVVGSRSERLAALEAHGRQPAPPALGGRPPRPMPDQQPYPYRGGAGDEVRAIASSESFAEAIAGRVAPLPDGIRAEDLSLGRAIKAMILGDWRQARAEQRTMGFAAGGGAYLVPSELSARVIDLARNAACVFRAGALTVPMTTAELLLAKITKDPTASWKGENQPATASDVELGQIALRARTLVAIIKCSVELMEDAGNFSSVVEGALASSLALELDRAALRGRQTAGPIEPGGVRWMAGVNLVAVNGFWNYDHVSTGVQKIGEANGPGADALAVVMSPRDFGTADRFKSGDGLPLVGPPSWTAMRKYSTAQIPTNLGTGMNESEIFIGAFPELLVGMRTELQIEASRFAADASSSAFSNLQVWVRAYLRADVNVARPPFFSVLTGCRVS